MSHNPQTPESAEALKEYYTTCKPAETPCKTAAALKDARKGLEEMNNHIKRFSGNVEELRDCLYAEYDSSKDIQRQLERARGLVSKLAEQLELDRV